LMLIEIGWSLLIWAPGLRRRSIDWLLRLCVVPSTRTRISGLN